MGFMHFTVRFITFSKVFCGPYIEITLTYIKIYFFLFSFQIFYFLVIFAEPFYTTLYYTTGQSYSLIKCEFDDNILTNCNNFNDENIPTHKHCAQELLNVEFQLKMKVNETLENQ